MGEVFSCCSVSDKDVDVAIPEATTDESKGSVAGPTIAPKTTEPVSMDMYRITRTEGRGYVSEETSTVGSLNATVGGAASSSNDAIVAAALNAYDAASSPVESRLSRVHSQEAMDERQSKRDVFMEKRALSRRALSTQPTDQTGVAASERTSGFDKSSKSELSKESPQNEMKTLLRERSKQNMLRA